MADPTPLELCTGSTPECPHVECPDDWHWGDDLPCSCTPDCARSDPAPLAPTAEEAIALIRSALDDGLILNRITPAGVPVFWRYDYRALPVSPIARPDWNGGWRNEQENAGHSDGCGGNCGTNDSDNPPCPAQDTQCVWPGCESTDVREWSRRSCEDHYIRADDWWGDDAPQPETQHAAGCCGDPEPHRAPQPDTALSYPSPGESAGFDAEVAALAETIREWGEVSGVDALAAHLIINGYRKENAS